MEARPVRAVLWAALLLVSLGARSSTPNFVVETADPQLCQQIAQAAETYRRDLAVEWLGQAMPNWSAPCVMTVQVGPHLGPGGATTFVFDRGEVYGWRMTIQGSAQRVLDSVLPHEVTHMILASYFRRPVPRWADEGAATTAEHTVEKQKHQKMLLQFLQTGRGIAFSQMFAMTDYPPDVMPLYAQGFALSDYLIQVGGRPAFLKFLADGMADGQWSSAVARHYNLRDLATLQNTWLTWVQQGWPRFEPRRPKTGPMLVSEPPVELRARPEPNLVLRQPKESPTPWYPGSTRPWTGGPLPTQTTRPQPIQAVGSE
jgi:hypothetical protein